MRRPTLNLTVNCVLLALCAWLAATGLLISFRLPGGSVLWDMTRHDWGEVHFWLALCLIAFTTLHVILHLDWIKNIARERWRNARAGSLMTLLFLFLILAAAVSLFAMPVEVRGGGGHRYGQRMH